MQRTSKTLRGHNQDGFKRQIGLPIRQDAWDKSYEVDEYPTGDKERTLG